jgi:putative FmdB family regulatory protein
MPTYDYECKACHHRFELFQSMSDAVKRKCPKCGKATLERLIGTGAALIFKGSGFYQTDYRTESYKKSAEADKKPAETKASDTKAADSQPKPADSGVKSESASKGSESTPAAKPAEPKPASQDQPRPAKGKSKR